MIDRTALIGVWGTLATVSWTLHEYIGIVAGLFTICFLAIKIYQALKEDK